MLELLKLIPEATSAIAVIVVVVLFLRHLREQSTQRQEIVELFNKKIEEVTSKYEGHFDKVIAQVLAFETRSQEQFRTLFDQVMGVFKQIVEICATLKSKSNGP